MGIGLSDLLDSPRARNCLCLRVWRRDVVDCGDLEDVDGRLPLKIGLPADRLAPLCRHFGGQESGTPNASGMYLCKFQ